MRGVCASIVFLSHWHLWSKFEPRGAFEQGLHVIGEKLYWLFYEATWPRGGHHPAVIGFFVLSGFCIHFPFEKRAQAGAPPVGWGDYFRRRFWRIMPVYWTASLLGLGLVAAERVHPSGSGLLEFHASSPASDVVVRLTALAGVYPREIFAGNYILNTVAVEILMYLIYPAFYYYAVRKRWTSLGAAFAFMYAATPALLQFATPFWVFNSVAMLGIFWFLGAYAAHRFVVSPARVPGVWVLVSWLGFRGLNAIPHFYGLNLIIQLVGGIVCALLILWLVCREREKPPQRTSFWRALRFTSVLSYSLYAVHTPILMLTTWALLVWARCEDYGVQLAAGLGASLAATLAVYYGVERVLYRPRVACDPIAASEPVVAESETAKRSSE